MDAPYIYQEYPKWVAVDDDGDPLNPGFILICSEADEPAPKAKPKK